MKLDEILNESMTAKRRYQKFADDVARKLGQPWIGKVASVTDDEIIMQFTRKNVRSSETFKVIVSGHVDYVDIYRWHNGRNIGKSLRVKDTPDAITKAIKDMRK